VNFGLWNFHYVRNRIAMAWFEMRLSCPMTNGHDAAVWAEVANILAMWRVFWPSSGGIDTAIYCKLVNQHNPVES
jgi:hypothetical protein